jgi:hypothetical protein
LQRRPTDAHVAALNREFADMLVDGKMTLGDALPEEENEPLLQELPRLIVPFNRRDCGRLRLLIDVLNNLPI